MQIVQILLAALSTMGVSGISSWLVDRSIKKEVDQLDMEPETDPSSGDSRTRTLEKDFTKMLRKYYAHGLSQARINQVTSVSFSVLGGLVLLGGVGLAIWKAETTGEFYAAIVTSVAGLVMSVVATLFHRRADKALEHLTDQTRNLRADMATERDARQAVELLDDVQNPALKSQLQAALILKFAQAEIPVLNGVHLNGTTATKESEVTVPAVLN
ncbi:TRADD-N-associated membrane domain-containing protein [Streptomyces sp. MMBL 11-3]|uniref:TRADD-N-associated membrane domain-containing protein n=1 Tax=Streptomyces sp. MMBL 11-3 TaxID=3382639 RepID=UPI0039B66A08